MEAMSPMILSKYAFAVSSLSIHFKAIILSCTTWN